MCFLLFSEKNLTAFSISAAEIVLSRTSFSIPFQLFKTVEPNHRVDSRYFIAYFTGIDHFYQIPVLLWLDE